MEASPSKLKPVSLDETITDTLKDVEREVLTKLRKHEAAVVALRSDVAALRERTSGSTSIPELRRIVSEADRLERELRLPREILAREALAQTEWPAVDLAEARTVLASVDACEKATQDARAQIAEDGSGASCSPESLTEVLQQLVGSWYKLRSTERKARASSALVVRRVDIALETKSASVRLQCDALLDKAVELHTGLAEKVLAGNRDIDSTLTVDEGVSLAVFTEKFRAFFQHAWVKEALEALQVEVPTSDLFQGPAEGEKAPPLEPAASGDSGVAAAAGGAVGDGVEVPTGPEQRDPEPAVVANDSDVAALPTVNLAAEAEDPLLRTVPAAGGAWARRSMEDTGGMAAQLPPSTQQLVAMGSAELWHAVHVGDQATVEAMISKDLCNAKMRDASGHTVLWHSVAFNHMNLASLMLDAFPPATERGVEVSEIHPRKGDTLLHLLCQSKTFGTQLAHIFKRISTAAPVALFQKVNRDGLTFLQIAARSLNFWVLTFVLRNFHAQAKALVCMPNNAPMRNLAEVIAQPAPPQFEQPAAFPEHFRVAEMLQQDEFGAVPYADVAFDVGPDSAKGAAGRFLAHRIIVATQSPVLFEALEKLPLTELPNEKVCVAIFRIDPRIAPDVWRSVLQFMYTGVINCTYASNVERVVELLRACALYQLPKPLLDFVQSCLYPLLPTSPPRFALQAFSICAGSAAIDEDLRPTREAAAYIILRSAHRLFEAMEAKEAALVLERVVQTVEHGVFNPRGSGAGAGPQPGGCSAPDHLSQSLRAMPQDAQVGTQARLA